MALDGILRGANILVWGFSAFGEALNIFDYCSKRDAGHKMAYVPDIGALFFKIVEKLTGNTKSKLLLKGSEVTLRAFSLLSCPHDYKEKKYLAKISLVRSFSEIFVLGARYLQEVPPKDLDSTHFSTVTDHEIIDDASTFGKKQVIDCLNPKIQEIFLKSVPIAASVIEGVEQVDDMRDRYYKDVEVAAKQGMELPRLLPLVHHVLIGSFPKLVRERKPDPFPECAITLDVPSLPCRDERHIQQYYEFSQLLAWVKEKRTNPLTRRPMQVSNIVLINFDEEKV